MHEQIRPIHRVEYGPGSGNTSHITQAPLFGSALIGSAATGASSILSPTPSTVTSKPTGHFDVQQMLQTISCKVCLHVLLL